VAHENIPVSTLARASIVFGVVWQGIPGCGMLGGQSRADA